MRRYFDDWEPHDPPTDPYHHHDDEEEAYRDEGNDEAESKKPLRRGVSAEGWFGILLGVTGAFMIFFFSVPFLLDWLTPTPTRATADLRADLSSEPSSAVPKLSPPASKPPVRELGATASSATRTLPQTSRRFWVQVGAFKDAENATRLATRLKTKHYPVVVRREKSATNAHLVWIGSYGDREGAEAMRTTLEQGGFRGFILKREQR